MSDQEKVYKFVSLTEYSLKQRISIRLADLAFFVSIRLLGALARLEVRGYEYLDAIEKAGEQPIYSFWHDRIFLSTYFFRDRGIVVMTSKSFDGEYIARFIQRFGYGAARGSSSQGSSRALIEMIRLLRKGLPMAFTVDGPRGPRYKAKPGPVILAKKTGNPILPFVIEPMNFWTVNSWDKMQVPRPFTRVLVIIGEPIYVPEKATDMEIEAKVMELQGSLDDLTKQGKLWSGRQD